ncbi:MAG: hypothetical protein KatS3mg058_3863 [Roseiflexus sp.]|nr:MAG: hypothetical protein KatS3mg058_3863 [Roseiflexus sp.]
MQEAITKDSDSHQFLALCQRITEHYVETRSPIGVRSSLHKEAIKKRGSRLDTVNQAEDPEEKGASCSIDIPVPYGYNAVV